ncbi:MAG: TIGR01777 family oxidoreductase [Chthoniobacterales bacterium]
MKVVIVGGTGQVGRVLTRAFHSAKNELVILSRHRAPNTRARVVLWNGNDAGAWTAELESATAVINLAGRSVNCRYGSRNRREIMQSRIDSVHAIGRAIQQAKRPPQVWLQASTATIYAHRFDAPNDEFDGIIGGEERHTPDTWRFSIDVAKAWESAVGQFTPLPKTRVVMMRSAMVMSPDPGGIFAMLRRLVRLRLGGRAGQGDQYISWIHEHDFANAVRLFIDNTEFSGVVNVCAPEPMPSNRFMRELRHACGVRVGLPATSWMLEIGAFLMRTETELILKSRRVIPRRLLESGFRFQFPHWPDAAADLCHRYRTGNQ